MKGCVLILGATSAIARHVAAALAERGHALLLAGRDGEELERLAADLRIRYGVRAETASFDADERAAHREFFAGALARAGRLDGVVLAFGYLGDQEVAAEYPEEAERIIERNFTGAVTVLNCCANYFEARRGGFIVGISSVAGDVGRRSNYFYGAAKGGLTLYLQGLRARLFPAGVRVLTVKPGFVDTPMTYGRPGLFLVATPEKVGRKIVGALEAGREVIYVPWFWRYVMLVLKLAPEVLLKRLKL